MQELAAIGGITTALALGAASPGPSFVMVASSEPKPRAGAATHSFAMGLTTQLSNPKTAIVYASVFAAFLPATTSPAFNLGIAGLVCSANRP